MRRYLKPVLLTLGGVFVAMQLVPYGWDHSNPPVTQDAPWPSAEARAIAVRACYDCHSNETDWPVYSYVAPMSWLVRRDVENGRAVLNFSTWDREQEADADDAADEVEDGDMPLRQYTLIHRDANLSDEEQRVLIDALEEMEEGGDDRDDDEDRSGSNSGPG